MGVALYSALRVLSAAVQQVRQLGKNRAGVGCETKLPFVDGPRFWERGARLKRDSLIS